MGTALANFQGGQDFLIFILALMTAVGFQVTSNFANDYGDGVKGTDNQDRIGPRRSFQSGLLSRNELKKGIVISSIFSILLVFSVLYFSFGTEFIGYFIVFTILGMASIWAAIKYTVGESAYGYKGLGDVFVFLFFGILAVMGTMFLYLKEVTWSSLLPAAAIGCLSTGVLNLNNLRDYTSDKKSFKNTLIVKIGVEKGKKYHYLLLSISFLCILLFTGISYSHWCHFIPLLAFLPIFRHLLKVFRTNNVQNLDPELKKLALSTFLLAFLFYLFYNNFL